VIFSILIFKVIQKSDLPLSTCASLYCSLQDMLSKIRKDFDELALNNKQKSGYQMVTTKCYHKETKSKETARK